MNDFQFESVQKLSQLNRVCHAVAGFTSMPVILESFYVSPRLYMGIIIYLAVKKFGVIFLQAGFMF